MEITSQILSVFSLALLALALPVYGQPGLPCTPAMVNSFTPCMNFLNNATANVSSPTPDCCNSLKSITTNSSGCFCLLVSGNVPFPIPVNRTLAISLPQACNMPGVNVQCKASTSTSTMAPVPAPGPAPSLPQSPSPAAAASPISPTTPTPTPASDAPPAGAVPSPAASTTPETTTPAAGSGGSGTAAPSPSSAIPSTTSPFLVVLGLGILSMVYA